MWIFFFVVVIPVLAGWCFLMNGTWITTNTIGRILWYISWLLSVAFLIFAIITYIFLIPNPYLFPLEELSNDSDLVDKRGVHAVYEKRGRPVH